MSLDCEHKWTHTEYYKLIWNSEVKENRTWNGNTTCLHIVTCMFIIMTGMWEILDQNSFLLYLSSNNGQNSIVSSLREEGRLSSGNDSSLTRLENWSDFSEEGRQFSGNDSSSEQLRKWRFLREERCRSPFPSKDFISERWPIDRDTREMGSNDSFITVLTISSTVPIVNLEIYYPSFVFSTVKDTLSNLNLLLLGPNRTLSQFSPYHIFLGPLDKVAALAVEVSCNIHNYRCEETPCYKTKSFRPNSENLSVCELMDNSTGFEWLAKKQNLKAGKQSSAVVYIGPASYKIIETMKKEKL